MHIVKIDSIGFGRCSELIEESVEVWEMGRDNVFEEMKQILPIGRLCVYQLRTSECLIDLGNETYPIDTGDLETESSSCIIGTIQVIAHDKNDIEQFSKQLGFLEVGTGFGQ